MAKNSEFNVYLEDFEFWEKECYNTHLAGQ